MATIAQERRFAAMREIGEFVRVQSANAYLKPFHQLTQAEMQAWFNANREELATRILAMHDLGRTGRWHAALDEWVKQIREIEYAGVQWAYNQYSIYAGYAAE